KGLALCGSHGFSLGLGYRHRASGWYPASPLMLRPWVYDGGAQAVWLILNNVAFKPGLFKGKPGVFPDFCIIFAYLFNITQNARMN
ncbi:MAG: hypothetical protein RBT73_11895, partial [Spirochaetia bacterium]|nr:hypothetical protein [Spirochaetia bacterium]